LRGGIHIKKFIWWEFVIRLGGKIAKKGKKEEPDDPGAPLKTGKPILFTIGLALLLIGLFISLGSVFHNVVEVFTNETSGDIYGPYDWAAAIVGALALLVGIIILMFSKSSPKSA
jgi:hypothetical protein